mgnify:CR=1 FL=1
MNFKQSGFTLLEVLVALTVFAIVGAALVKNAAQTVKQTASLEERTIAVWLAENQLNEIRSAPRADNNYLSPGTDRLPATMAGQDWEILVDYEATANEDMRRVTVSVFYEDQIDSPIVSLTGFVGRF